MMGEPVFFCATPGCEWLPVEGSDFCENCQRALIQGGYGYRAYGYRDLTPAASTEVVPGQTSLEL